jgi:hypothetical protein
MVAASIVAAALAALSSPAFSQADDVANPPKAPCPKPEDFPGRLATDRAKGAWKDTVSAYQDCIKKFVDNQKALADMHTKAANAAVEEHNVVVKKAKDEVDAANQ